MKMLQILTFIGISCLISGYKIPPPFPPMPPLPSLPDSHNIDDNCAMCVPMLCNDVSNCKNGVKKDECDCCDICVKMDGESCGGPHSQDGVCDKDHTCSIRHPKSHKNMLVFKMEEKYGKCEHEKCMNKQCGMHQWCKITNGLPVCHCEEKCKDVDIPLCGRVNGVQYKNPCELRKAECKTQEHIGANFGQCQKCFDDKTDTYYNSGEIFTTQTECEKGICRNGRFTYGIDEECLAKKGFSCSLQSTIHEDIHCNALQYCEIIQKSSDLDKYPHAGKCRNASLDFCYINGKKYKAGEHFVDEECSGSCNCGGLNSFDCVSLCPPEGIMCNEDEVESSVKVQVSKTPICYCPQPTCVKKSEICKMDKIQGDCFASMRRWYHDVNDGQCKMFIYGGCGGNKNNFYSKETCESACINNKKDPMSPQITSLNPSIRVPKHAQASPMVYTGDSAGPPGSETIGAPGSEEAKPWTWPVGTGRKTPLSEKTMTIYGHVKFVGKMQILPTESCMVVSFKDVTRMDSMATILKTMKYDVSKFDTRNLFTFSMSTLKPIVDGYASYSIKADVFVGRCQSRNSIQQGDYLTTKRYSIVIADGIDSYKTDIITELYGYEESATKSETDASSFEKTPALYFSDASSEKDETVDETGFPDATNPGPQLSDKTMQINGELVFNKMITFKSPSCLRIKLVDVSLMDVSYAVIAETVLNMTNVEVNQTFKFVLESPKPSKDEYWRTYSLKVVLNNGWCFMDGSDKWIAEGDFYNDYQETITITNKDVYFKKFNVVKYGIKKMKSPPKPTLILDDVIEEGLDMEDEEDDEEGYVAETGFPDATNPGPRLSNETMTIKGVLKFSKDTIQFPSPSCLHIEFIDTSLMDVAYAIVSSKSISMNNTIVNKKFEFELESRKPVEDDLSRVYSLKIVLNNGWCSGNDNKSTEWLRVGDYLNDYQVNVDLTKEDNEYSLTIPVMCYAEEKTVFPVIPDEEDELTKEEILGNETMIVSGFVEFMDKPGILLNNSCLLIKIQDVTVQDISAVIIQTKIYPLSLFNMSSDFNYTIISRKPLDEKLWRSFSISAVLNHGWCSSGNKEEWIRQGDYLNDFNVELNITTDSNTVKRNIPVVCYDCDLKNTNETSMEFIVPDIPKMGDSKMKIEGNILFDTTLGLLPNSSCVHIMFLDVTTADEAIILATSVLDISETYVKKSIRYSMEAFKPVDTELWRSFEITATLNKGWCPKPRSDEWIKSGDYLSETSVMVDIKKSESFFVVDIPLTEYALDNESKNKFISFDEGLKNITKKELNINNKMNVTRDKQYDSCKSQGQTYQHGENYYKFPCENCECIDGEETCFSVECLPLEDCENPINLQDACCPVCNDPIIPKSCIDTVNGKNMTHLAGEKWSPDPCTFCECDDGNIICAMMSCAGCSDHMEIVKVPGKCCPECKPKNITCLDKNTNITYLAGEKWKSTPCSDCECTRWGPLCSMIGCLSCRSNDKVVIEKDQCCPKCIPQPDEATCFDMATNRTYRSGEKWKPDACTDCECTAKGSLCSMMDCLPCRSTDKVVIKKDQCCPKCIPQPEEATCFDMATNRTYRSGEKWKPDACADCECTAQGSLCSTMDCLPCSNTDTVVYEKDQCCPKCIPPVELKCFDKITKKTYLSGEKWNTDVCTMCQCDGNNVMCIVKECSACDSGDELKFVDGQCCPECVKKVIVDPPKLQLQCVDKKTNKTYKDGESYVESDGCTQCGCYAGFIYCASPQCAIPSCPNGDIINVKGVCCPVCSTSTICVDATLKKTYVEGNIWQNDMCEICSCKTEGFECEEPNYNVDNCDNVVRLSPKCARICLKDRSDSSVDEP